MEISEDVKGLDSTLMELLGLPKSTYKFSITFEANATVVVSCWYYAELDTHHQNEIIELFQEFNLEKR